MPICFMPGRFPGKDKDEADEVLTHPEWREPPGYLGEAVRRAKRIASLSRPDDPCKPASRDR
jgi:hypothetical protein